MYCLVYLSVLPEVGYGDTLNVIPGMSIQIAIDAADPGDIIIAGPGTYNELIDFKGKAIQVRSSDGPEVTVIDGTGIGGSVARFASNEGEDSLLDGFTITGGNGSDIGGLAHGGGILVNAAAPTVRHCIIENNTAENGGGVCTRGDSGPLFKKCLIRSNAGTLGGGLCSLDTSAPVFLYCRFLTNSASQGGSGFVQTASPDFSNCFFVGNDAQQGGGIFASGGAPTFANSTLTANDAIQGGGMFVDGSLISVVNTILWANTDDSGMTSSAQIHATGPGPNVSYSCVQGGWGGAGSDNISQDPMFTLPPDPGLDGTWGSADDDFGDLRPQPTSPCIDAGSSAVVELPDADLEGLPRISNGTVDMGPFEFQDCNGNGIADDGEFDSDGDGVIDDCDSCLATTPGALVDLDGCPRIHNTSLNVSYAAIQDAIDAASPGNVILVGPGTYHETIDFKGKELMLESLSGAMTTIIDGTDLNDSVMKCVNGEGAATILRGFTVTGGTGHEQNIFGSDPTYHGGGMLNMGSSPSVTDCVFIGNQAGSGGGMYNIDGSPTITNCSFVGNDGSGIYNWNCSAIVSQCTFEGNTASPLAGGMNDIAGASTIVECRFEGNTGGLGGGLYSSGSSSIIRHCTFMNNVGDSGGGGAWVSNPGSPLMANCLFVANQAGGEYGRGGGLVAGSFRSELTLLNCVFIENDATMEGGAIFSTSQGGTLIANCTLVNNEAPDTGGIYNWGLSVLVKNSIVWGNSGGEIGGPRPLEISYCDIQGGWPGTGNIDADPQFADAAGGDFHLTPASPCRDAGDPGGDYTGQIDLDGSPRVIYGTVDIGADEFVWKADYDLDGDVDGTDFLTFSNCFNGALARPKPACENEASDLDEDGDVDISDFLTFSICFNGALHVPGCQ